MPVENTASPNVSPTAPKASPRNVRPSSRTSSASRWRVIGRLRTRRATFRPRHAGVSGPEGHRSGGGGSCELAVEDGGLAAQEGRDDGPGQLATGERGVAA